MNSKIRFRTLRIFIDFLAEWMKFFPFLKGYISKTKNRKIDFSFVSENYATIWTKK